MKLCQVASFLTPDNLQLGGLVFGSADAKKGSSLYMDSVRRYSQSMTFCRMGMMRLHSYFNNRGHDNVTGIKRIRPELEKGYEWYPAGAAREIFTECVLDIRGAVEFMKRQGTEDIYLVGHSTGCQKTAYYLSQNKANSGVKGAVLICPVSDYAAASSSTDPKLLANATRHALELINAGKGSDLLDLKIWPELITAQRFVSLNTPDSIEEIFCYGTAGKRPEILQSIKQPLLILLAECDEYHDRSVYELVSWFEQNKPNSTVEIIQDSLHSLKDQESRVKALIINWLQKH